MTGQGSTSGTNAHALPARGPAQPIGIFDSGVGGLSVLADLRRVLPHEDVLYLADSAHVPYGDRDRQDVQALTLAGVNWLREQGCKLVVIACNTACAFSLNPVREALDLPVVGLVPALKPAVHATRSGRVAVLATRITLDGDLLEGVVTEHARPNGVQVMKLWERRLVPLVEAGGAQSDEARALLHEVLTPALQAGVDALVLGCTHYPYLAPAIRAEFGDAFTLFDSGDGVARQTRRRLEAVNALNPAGTPGRVSVFTTGDPARVTPGVRQLLPDAPTVQHATVLPV
ncbi:glutamate racemase [Deinococcus aquiradiocola]|uniref:Glutamate racemase n=1 Tax=Deinococcus aquiradiocola TaxID=393059 RepID=A0A917P4C3_9DEIO|nr:glutamate racemase [Deinococcus aquiradiocola]GGJ60851.1 glutamate racemase [Deinococcus aquiradiocola]